MGVGHPRLGDWVERLKQSGGMRGNVNLTEYVAHMGNSPAQKLVDFALMYLIAERFEEGC
jgi:hypothetical protein